MGIANTGVATGGEAVTPSDTVNLTKAARSLWVGGDGDLSVLTVDGQTLTIVGAAAGTVVPLAVRRVNATGTTATNIVALH